MEIPDQLTSLLRNLYADQEATVRTLHGTTCLLACLLRRFSRVWLCVTPEMAAHQVPPSLGFSRQEHWSGLPFPSPEDLPDQGSNLGFPHCRQTLYHLSHPDFRKDWKQESSRKTSTFALLTTPKPLTVWITTNCEKFLEMGRADYLICLLRHLYAGQEATFKTGHGTTDWFQIGKEVW